LNLLETSHGVRFVFVRRQQQRVPNRIGIVLQLVGCGLFCRSVIAQRAIYGGDIPISNGPRVIGVNYLNVALVFVHGLAVAALFEGNIAKMNDGGLKLRIERECTLVL
jgi:hypothetical protein